MSPSEIAFLALGIVLGAAIGAAIVEAVRSRPAPRREVRVTISPNSVSPRRSSTLAEPSRPRRDRPRMPGSPEDDAWFDGPRRRPSSRPSAPAGRAADPAIPDRTRVLSARRRPLDRGRRPRRPPAPWPRRHRRPSGGDAGAPPADRARRPARPAPPQPAPRPAVAGAGPDRRRLGARCASRRCRRRRPRARSRAADARSGRARRRAAAARARSTTSPAIAPVRPSRRRRRRTGRRTPRSSRGRPRAPTAIAPASSASPSSPRIAARRRARRVGPMAPARRPTPADADPCADHAGSRRRALRASPRPRADQARAAAEALREAQRAYDTLRERVERAQADADPRALAAGKDALHRRVPGRDRDAARGAEDTEAAAREWLDADQRAQHRAPATRQRLAEAGARGAPGARCPGSSGWASRRTPHGSARRTPRRPAGRRASSSPRARRPGRSGARRPPARRTPRESEALDDAPLAADTGTLAGDSFERQVPPTQAGDRGLPVSSGSCAATARPATGWSPRSRPATPRRARCGSRGSRSSSSAITARAIEDGYLDMPDDDTFWSLFTPRESREIVARAVGARLSGSTASGGFADERVPAQRDLSLAVGYAGLDRMRIRNWPRERELAELYEQADRRGRRVAGRPRRRPDAGRDGRRAGPARRRPRGRLERLGPRPAARSSPD